MSTRSAIVQRCEDGTYRGIYCHHDGYLDFVGRLLRDHYSDAEKVDRLIDLGHISQLGKRIDPVGPHSFKVPEEGTTVAYGRDRGETGCEPVTGSTIQIVAEKLLPDGRLYVYADGAWTLNGHRIPDGDLPDDDGDWLMAPQELL